MELKKIKIDKSWKVLIYFDFILPAILFFIAWITGSSMLSKLFHSYETFVISPIPNFTAYTGIIGLIFHLGIIIYALLKEKIKDVILCILITLLVVLFFYFELNYAILRPLQF
ncbi:MAG: hypothetical protein GX957_16210 [Clostridiaceae bacterium]|nr:hypothetical protein [Clostridiaceae bacterium]